VALPDGEVAPLAEGDSPGARVAAGERDVVEVSLAVEEGGVSLAVPVGVGVGEPVPLPLAVVLPLSEVEPLLDGLAPAGGVAVGNAEAAVELPLTVAEGVGGGVPEADSEPLPLPLGGGCAATEGAPVADSVGVGAATERAPVADSVGVGDGGGEGTGAGEPLSGEAAGGEAFTEPDPVPLTAPMLLLLPLPLLETVGEPEVLKEPAGVPETEAPGGGGAVAKKVCVLVIEGVPETVGGGNGGGAPLGEPLGVPLGVPLLEGLPAAAAL
jgi:hypothetical protein